MLIFIINSYSSLDEAAKVTLMMKWNAKWDEFVASSKRLFNPFGKQFYPQTTTINPRTTATNMSIPRTNNGTDTINSDASPQNVSQPRISQNIHGIDQNSLLKV